MFFLVFLQFCISLFSQAVISELKGSAYWRINSLSQWQKVESLPLEIPQGGAVKLEEDSFGKIIINKESEIFLYDESALEIEAVSKYYVGVGLVYGRGRFRILFPPGSSFMLKTISSEFVTRRITAIFESDMEGKTEAYVGIGECKFRYRVPHKSGKREFVLTQGMYFKVENSERPYVFRLINDKEEREIFGDFQGYNEDFDLKIKKNQKLISFSNYALKISEKYSSDVLREKNADFESGRTLYDVHGNLVRVSQRILRPELNKIQFLSIIKRPNYADYLNTDFSSSYTGFKYNGNQINNRLDFFAITFSFNKNLPENIMKFPSFFSNPSVKAEWATFVAANLSDNMPFFVAEAYKYNKTRDELINNTESVGVTQDSDEKDNDVIIAGKIDKSYLYDIVNYNFVEQNPSSPTGNLVRKTDNLNINGAFWGLKKKSFEVNGDIFKLRGTQYIKGGSGNNYFWITSETFLISSSGKLTRKKDISSSFESLSQIINKNFVESIFYIKEDNSGNVTDTSYNGIDNNIDIVLDGLTLYSSFEYVYEGIKRWKD
ncbi:MAG: hypothetical protein N2446_03375 [Elusimicrobiales bacterium]|nr:hypothetical protein [Elusimicrobiales bacterium]